eukprot:2480738-Rhodomonas_salina.2
MHYFQDERNLTPPLTHKRCKGSDTQAASWESEGTFSERASPYLYDTCTNSGYEHNGTSNSTRHRYGVEYRATAHAVPSLRKGTIQHDRHSRPG